MGIQHWRQGSLGFRQSSARHWLWLILSIVLLAGSLVVYCAPAMPATSPRGGDAAAAICAQVARSVRSSLDIQRADPLTQLQADSQNPETQSVLRYLRLHQVDQSLWDQAIARVQFYLQRQ
jgi:hypothetical protein